MRGADRLRDSLLHTFLLGHEFGVSAEQNVGPAASHVGGDRDHAFASRLRHNLRFALVILRVQDDVLDSLLLQQLRKALGLFNRGCADQDRLIAVVQPLDLVRGREIFFFLRAIDNVRILFAQQSAIGRNDDDFKPVNLVEFRSFGFRCSRHTGQLFVHAEIILERDRGEGLILALNLHILLGLDRLMQPVGPAPPRHQASGKFIHNDHFAVFDHILDVLLVKRVRFDGGLHMMLQRPVFRICNVADAQQLFDFFPAVVADRYVAVLFIHHVIPGHDLRLARRGIDFFTLFKLGDNPIYLVILVGGLFTRARNDKRGPGVVDQDGIDLVDNREVVHALHAVPQIELHVVAQIVETEFVVRAIGHVGRVSGAALLVIKVVHNHAHRQAEKAVQFSHPLRVALSQVIIDGHDMDAASAQGVQIHRKSGDQCFALAGLHLRDRTFVQHHAADQLHVKMPHV